MKIFIKFGQIFRKILRKSQADFSEILEIIFQKYGINCKDIFNVSPPFFFYNSFREQIIKPPGVVKGCPG